MHENNLLTRLITQLNTLIPFLAISRRDVFELMQQERYIWFPENQQEAFPDSYEVYQIQITHAAFLPGYSYAEAFLADLVRKIYQQNPRMLPSEKQLKFSDILGTSTYEEVVNVMIEKEILALFYQSMEKIIKYFQEKLCLDWDERYCRESVIASLTRNCIIHNMSRVDERLSQASSYTIGDKIQLSVSDVHRFGTMMRGFARNLYGCTEERYFTRNA